MSRISATLAVVLSIGWLVQDDSDDPLFVHASRLVVGSGPGDIALADLNGDGHLDMVTQHLQQRLVSVHIGDGSGRFVASPAAALHLDYEPAAMSVGDINLDGTPDLAIASQDSQRERIQVFLGTGSGAFRPLSSPHGTSPSAEFYKPVVHILDVNEDGTPDIVTSNARRNSIEILLGDGRGRFTAAPVIALEGGHEFYSFALGDVDGDGHLDLVTALGGSGADRILVALGDGRGSFREGPAAIRTAANPRAEALADVDGDGDLDIIVSHATRKQLSVFVNAETGAFRTAAKSPYEIAAEGFAAVVADADRDGRPDILAATVNSVTVLRGTGAGFAPVPGSPFTVESGAYRLAIGDINEDGRLDVAASGFDSDSVTLLVQR